MVIASMAVISSRQDNLLPILRNLECQTRPPDKVLLYYSISPWHHDEGISNLILPPTSLDVECIPVPNLGSCRKYLFSIFRYRNTDHTLLLLDDDMMFDSCLIENLCYYHSPMRRVVATRGWTGFVICQDDQGRNFFSRPSKTTVIGSSISAPKEVIVTSSGWSTMFYPRDVDPRMFDRVLQRSVSLGYSDEIFLAAMLPESKYVIPMPEGFRHKLSSVSGLNKDPETIYAKAKQAELLAYDYKELKLVV